MVKWKIEKNTLDVQLFEIVITEGTINNVLDKVTPDRQLTLNIILHSHMDQ